MWLEILLMVLSLYIVWQCCKKPAEYPPGYWGLPLVGYIPIFQRKKFEGIISELHKKYKTIASWRIGSRLIVILFDIKLMKEAFSSSFTFVDRPSLKMFSMIENPNNRYGVLSSNGEHWQRLRRFSLHHLRDLGMGKSSLAAAIQHEAECMVQELKKNAGKPSKLPPAIITISVINIIWQLVASKRYDFNDKKIIRFEEMIREFQQGKGIICLLDFMPWISYVLPKFLLDKITKKELRFSLSQEFTKFSQKHIEEHKANLDYSETPKDYIDAYLIEIEKQKADPSSLFSEKDLVNCIVDLFGAGSETTTMTLYWTIFFLASFPHVQTRLQKEIDEKLPFGTSLNLEDKAKMSYTEAFIHEVLRYSSLASIGAIHMASVDTRLGGYLIPKGTFVVAAQYWKHFDTNNFESPNEFKPERFLNSEGKFVNSKEAFVPFGAGRRQCLGEALARMELIIFITTLVQHLHFSIPKGETLDLTPIDMPILRIPKRDQNILITIRNHD